MMMGTPFSVDKGGAFTAWSEDEESAELKLPLPDGATKRDIKAVFTPSSLSITLRSDASRLLVVSPLAGRIVSDETTWYLEDSVMVITLQKQVRSAKLWGKSLAASDGGATLDCWLPPEEVNKRLGIVKSSTVPSKSGVDWVTISLVVAAVAVVFAMGLLLVTGA